MRAKKTGIYTIKKAPETSGAFCIFFKKSRLLFGAFFFFGTIASSARFGRDGEAGLLFIFGAVGLAIYQILNGKLTTESLFERDNRLGTSQSQGLQFGVNDL